MPDRDYPDPREEDIVYDDRRISRPDTSLPDWYASDTAYRPIPIVWFAGALILQVIAMPVVFLLGAMWLALPPLLTVAVALLVSGFVWHIAMARGLRSASISWRFATGTMLAFFFGITALTALA